MLQITHTVEQNLLVVNLVGSLTGPGSDNLSSVLNEWLAAGGKRTLIDLGGVAYICSEGVKVLLHHASALHKANGRLILSAVHDSTFQVFEVGGFTRLFEFVDTLDDGLQLLAAGEDNSCSPDGNLKKAG